MSNLRTGLEKFNNGNHARAFTILMPIAAEGGAEAQCLIANMYQLGKGVEYNISLAIKWYGKSANQGYGVASNNLGEIFLAGADNILPDRDKAVSWCKKAEKQGFMHARKFE